MNAFRSTRHLITVPVSKHFNMFTEGRANTATGQHLSTTGLPIQESHVINPTTDNTEMTSAYLVPDFKEDLYSTECYRDLLPAGPIAAVEHDYYNEGGHYVNQA